MGSSYEIQVHIRRTSFGTSISATVALRNPLERRGSVQAHSHQRDLPPVFDSQSRGYLDEKTHALVDSRAGTVLVENTEYSLCDEAQQPEFGYHQGFEAEPRPSRGYWPRRRIKKEGICRLVRFFPSMIEFGILRRKHFDDCLLVI